MAYYHSGYRNFGKSKRKKRIRRVIFLFLFVIILIGSGISYWLYGIIFNPNVWTADGKEVSVYIPTGSNIDSVKRILYVNGLIVHRNNFEWWVEKKKYSESVKPGKYVLRDGMSNNDLINLLRSGSQTPVQVIFNNIRDINQLAGKVGRQIETDSTEIVNLLQDSVYIANLGFNKATISTLFIPNTYEFFWNTSAEGFIVRMQKEYNKFWNEDRKVKAARLNLTKSEVVTVASIVEKETNKNAEKPDVAGVYINRLNAGWRLQADPTVIYALNDYTIRRVLNVHMQVQSPYNTYLHAGLPPGPICIPGISSVDAVLNYRDHDYLFFCAKDDLSGYHVFAKTNAQHNRNAKKYQKALNEMKIYK